MSDIVERLRAAALGVADAYARSLIRVGADEVERLRAERDALRADVERFRVRSQRLRKLAHDLVLVVRDSRTRREQAYACAMNAGKDAARYAWLRKNIGRGSFYGVSKYREKHGYVLLRSWELLTRFRSLETLDDVIDAEIAQEVEAELATTGGHEHHEC